MEIKLEKNVEQKLIISIQRYLSEELGVESGELKAKLFLRFCVEEIGPEIYNLAISDAQTYLRERVEDLENVCFVKDGQFWKNASRRLGTKTDPNRR